ncbi:hypothetical protein [uncultured Sphaerotilus sp.]|uniref:hypothetical protein n=1 Tax=uncultured Sphaerotilus sp. TaxID=474984 RepID=UPI0030CA44F7
MSNYNTSRFCAPDLMVVDYKISDGDVFELNARKKIHKYRELGNQMLLLKKLEEKIKTQSKNQILQLKDSDGGGGVAEGWISNETVNNLLRCLILNDLNVEIDYYEEQIFDMGLMIEDRFIKILNTIALCINSCEGDKDVFVISANDDFTTEMKEEIRLRFPVKGDDFLKSLYADFLSAFKRGLLDYSGWELSLVRRWDDWSIKLTALDKQSQSSLIVV